MQRHWLPVITIIYVIRASFVTFTQPVWCILAQAWISSRSGLSTLTAIGLRIFLRNTSRRTCFKCTVLTVELPIRITSQLAWTHRRCPTNGVYTYSRNSICVSGICNLNVCLNSWTTFATIIFRISILFPDELRSDNISISAVAFILPISARRSSLTIDIRLWHQNSISTVLLRLKSLDLKGLAGEGVTCREVRFLFINDALLRKDLSNFIKFSVV